jgi:hypothetical protein
MYLYAYVCVCVCVCVCVYVCVCIYIHIYTHTYIHAGVECEAVFARFEDSSLQHARYVSGGQLGAVGAVEVYDPSGKEGGGRGGGGRPQKSAFESSSEEEEEAEEEEEEEEEEAIASRMWAMYRSRALGVGEEEEGGWELDEEALAGMNSQKSKKSTRDSVLIL